MFMKREIWKDISDYEGKYQISSFGRIKSLNYRGTGTEKIMTPGVTQGGYLKIKLRKNGSLKWFSVHRLVASIFITNPNNLPDVNHKDHNRQNNNADNLEWMTTKENTRYSLAKKVACYKDGKLVKIYDCIADTEKDGFKHSLVSKVALGKAKHHHGHFFKYCQ